MLVKESDGEVTLENEGHVFSFKDGTYAMYLFAHDVVYIGSIKDIDDCISNSAWFKRLGGGVGYDYKDVILRAVNDKTTLNMDVNKEQMIEDMKFTYVRITSGSGADMLNIFECNGKQYSIDSFFMCNDKKIKEYQFGKLASYSQQVSDRYKKRLRRSTNFETLENKGIVDKSMVFVTSSDKVELQLDSDFLVILNDYTSDVGDEGTLGEDSDNEDEDDEDKLRIYKFEKKEKHVIESKNAVKLDDIFMFIIFF